MDNYNFKTTPCVLHSTRKGYPKRCLAKAVCSDAYDIIDRYNKKGEPIARPLIILQNTMKLLNVRAAENNNYNIFLP